MRKISLNLVNMSVFSRLLLAAAASALVWAAVFLSLAA
jgi:hypothetical protein